MVKRFIKGEVQIPTIAFIGLILFVAIVVTVFLSTSDSLSKQRLEGHGYVVLAAGEYESLQAQIAAVRERTDNLPDSPASETTASAAVSAAVLAADKAQESLDRLNAVRVSLSYYSIFQVDAALAEVASDVALPNVVVANFPAGETVHAAYMVFTPRMIDNTQVVVATNHIDGNQYIKVKDSAGAWGVNDINAMLLTDGLFDMRKNTIEPGAPFVGEIDISSVVDGNGTYNFRFEDGKAVSDFLEFNDVKVGIILYY